MRSTLDRRLRKIEAKHDGGLPAYIREWLGEPLSDEERQRAMIEWAEVRSRRPADPSSFSREHRQWLFDRRQAA